MAISLIVFFALYVALAVIDVVLMAKYARKELAAPIADDATEPVPAMTY